MEGLPQAHVVTLYCKDKRKGFGFHIENHEEDSGVYKMIVSNITSGGAADTSGQLQVGDWILSVDGTSTLGYAVEKVYKLFNVFINNIIALSVPRLLQASDLIQQGVSRGQVNLLIASRELLSPLSQQFWSGHMRLGVWGGEMLESADHEERDSGNMMKDTSKGALLKNKKMIRTSE